MNGGYIIMAAAPAHVAGDGARLPRARLDSLLIAQRIYTSSICFLYVYTSYDVVFRMDAVVTRPKQVRVIHITTIFSTASPAQE
jgi:hypothetical protein